MPLLNIITQLSIHYTEGKKDCNYTANLRIKLQEQFFSLIDKKENGAMYNCNSHRSKFTCQSGLQMAGKSLQNKASQRAKFCHHLVLCVYTEIDGVVQVFSRAEFDPLTLVEIVLKEKMDPIGLNIAD